MTRPTTRDVGSQDPRMAGCESLVQGLDSGDPKIIRQAALDLADSGCLEAVPRLLQMFAAGDLATMGALAYALGELHVQEAKPRLLELMKDVRTRGSRGSLMYALMNLNCNDDYDDILEFTHDDVWEVRQKALIILDDIAPFQNTAALISGRVRLLTRLEDASLHDEARSHLAEAVEAHDVELLTREDRKQEDSKNSDQKT
ncbi:HEAT repeat domain-containing protein [Planctomyces sp. SH-PL62]|uniref:HEAT repeat domain-containing protein n=1 Tax=Planctomyces sp. SH-PL62 TaxID=1636152 RepID=UPI0012E97AA3|nr:HEAT repeat domain-containing protein [Planctomyces sp. SH-PL62]